MYRAGNDGHDHFNTGKEYMPPVCNEVFSKVDTNTHLGWYSGYLGDGMPFCAEKTCIHTATERHEWATFIMPLMPERYKTLPNSHGFDSDWPEETIETEWRSVLCEGMMVLGQVLEPSPLLQHVNYLEQHGILRFPNDERNGLLLRLMDFADRPVTAVVVLLKENDRVWAETSVPWRSFDVKPKKKSFMPQVKLWWNHALEAPMEDL